MTLRETIQMLSEGAFKLPKDLKTLDFKTYDQRPSKHFYNASEKAEKAFLKIQEKYKDKPYEIFLNRQFFYDGKFYTIISAYDQGNNGKSLVLGLVSYEPNEIKAWQYCPTLYYAECPAENKLIKEIKKGLSSIKKYTV